MSIKTIIHQHNKWMLFSFSISVVLLLIISVSRIFYPYDVGHYEAGIWAPSEIAIKSINPYSFNHTYQEPYTMAPYGALYYYIVGIGLKLFGLQFWFARLLSLIGIFISCYCIHFIIKSFTENKSISLLGIIIFLTQFSVQAWIGIQRPDIISLTFILISLALVFFNKENANSLFSIVLPALFVTSAVLVRQTSVLPIGFISAFYFFNKKYKHCFAFISIVFLILFFTMFVLNNTSDNGYLWQQFIMPSAVDKNFATGFIHFKTFIFSPSTFFVLVLFFIGYFRVRSKKYQQSVIHKKLSINVLLLRFYFVLSLLLSLTTASRIGSNINYYLETSAILSVVIPIYFSSKNDSFVLRKEYNQLLFLIILSSIFTEIRVCRGEYFRWKSKAYYQEIVMAINKHTSQNSGCFSVYPELIEFAERKNYFNDFVQYDGRAPLQHNIYNKLYRSSFFSSIVTYDSIAPKGYYRYNLKTKAPEKYYKVYLFLRNDSLL